MKTIFQQILRIPALLAFGLMTLPAPTLAEEPAALVPVQEPGGWRIEWPTVEGQQYQLQRSPDLLSWENVFALPVKATGRSLVFRDAAVLGQPRAYWRVVRLGISTVPLTVSPVVASFRSTQNGLRAELGVLTGGTAVVARVDFLDGTRLLGTAGPGGGGNDWSFLLPEDLETPQTIHLLARVTAETGEVIETPGRRLLLADPSRFIPLGADGSRNYGDFIEVDSAGLLGAFVFYPEGLGDADLTTGVHLEFPGGSRMQVQDGAPGIQFTNARFFAGHEDPAPVSLAGSTRRLGLSGISPAVLGPILGLAAGTPVPVRFGRTAMRWQSGALGPQGWAALKVSGAAAVFVVPDQQLNSTIIHDPETKTPWLVDRYSGEWHPVPGGPVFRVPEADPLTFQHNRENLFFASGTVEVEFPQGTKARGSVSLRNDVFEFRFEGRSITIPALAAVRRLLPADPALLVPGASATPGQLDLAAKGLLGFRDLFRSLSSGGQEQSALTTNETPAPQATPGDAAGATLAAWAARLATWQADRGGVLLLPPDLAQLSKAVSTAARTGVAAHDPATPLKMLRDILVLRRQAPGIIGSGPDAAAFTALLGRAEDELFTAATRLITDRGEFTTDEEAGEVAALLLKVDQAAGEVLLPARGAAPRAPRDAPSNAARERARAMAGDILTKLPVLLEMKAEEGNAAFFTNKTTGNLLEILVRLRGLMDALKAQGLGNRLSDAAPARMPFLQRLRTAFLKKHGDDFFDGGVAFVRDYPRLRLRLADRARYFQLNADLGEPLASDDAGFDPSTAGLLTHFITAFAEHPQAESAVTGSADLANMAIILKTTTDNGRLSDVEFAQEKLRASVDTLQNRNAAGNGDRLGPLLRKLGLAVLADDPAFEGLQTIKATGQFESVSGRSTLQLSQGGRYLRGSVQFNAPSASSYHLRIDGLLAAESSAAVEFSIVVSSDDAVLEPDHIRQTGTLRVSLEGGEPVAELSTKAMGPLAKLLQGFLEERFRRTSPDPVWSRRLASALRGEAGIVFEAQQAAPLHSGQLPELKRQVPFVVGAVESYLRSPSIPDERRTEIGRINNQLSQVLQAVGDQQIPVARQLYRQMMNRENFTAEGVTLSAWNWLRVIYSRHTTTHAAEVTQFSKFMGPDILASSSGNAFRYKVTIRDVSVEFGVGSAGFIQFSIEKRLSSELRTSPPASTIKVRGAFLQGGVGLSKALPLSAGETEVEVLSNVEYNETALSGPVMLMGVSAGVGIGVNSRSLSEGSFSLFGNGSLPALVVPLPFASGGDLTLSIGIQTDFALGVVIPVGTEVPRDKFNLIAEPLEQALTIDAAVEGAAFFDLNLATLRPVGRLSLRELAAEYRAIFESADSNVSVLGFTDSSGNENANATLSQQRADAVKQSLLKMIGPQHSKVPDARFRAIGLGENPSRNLAVSGVTLTEAEAALVLRKQTLLGPPLPDGVKDPRWRTAHVLLNNLITVEISLPAKEVAP